jgi:hypothetical protein
MKATLQIIQRKDSDPLHLNLIIQDKDLGIEDIINKILMNNYVEDAQGGK